MLNTNMKCWNQTHLIPVFSINITQNSDWVSINDEFIVHKNMIMEQTPFKDKNCKPIFEGDIVSVRIENNIYNKRDEFTHLIVYKTDTQYSISQEASGGPDGYIDYSDFEIIGNFFENKDALEKVPAWQRQQFQEYLENID